MMKLVEIDCILEFFCTYSGLHGLQECDLGSHTSFYCDQKIQWPRIEVFLSPNRYK